MLHATDTLIIYSFCTCIPGLVLTSKDTSIIFQDFKIEHFRDTPKAFADLVPELIEPLEVVADSLAAHYQDPVTKQPQSGYFVVVVYLAIRLWECIYSFSGNTPPIPRWKFGSPYLSKTAAAARAALPVLPVYAVFWCVFINMYANGNIY